MFDIDDKFMEEIGILTMPKEARDQLVAGIEQSIKNKVFIAVADDLNDFLQSELESIGESQEFAKDWLSRNLPHYDGSNEFTQFSQRVGSQDDITVEQLYAYTKWFEMNIPTFGSILEQVKEQVKQELKQVSGKA
ncbi:MAG TPA: hypothetical protein PK265_00540 [Candidatus Saccharibacteria bacterium]|nr:hypothetical protein [Candidatus Saccharibacteria bacterium]HRQ97801.1 hypothetical protein [Candidatus Saccharibacteria bacterium]